MAEKRQPRAYDSANEPRIHLTGEARKRYVENFKEIDFSKKLGKFKKVKTKTGFKLVKNDG